MPTALITGAGRGIGRATAVALAEVGYRLVLVSRTSEELGETARLVGLPDGGKSGPPVLLPGDVTDLRFVAAAVETAVTEAGGLNAVVHCAGLAPLKPVEATSIDDFDQVISVNLTAAYALAHYAWPTLKKQGGGSIVTISSRASRDPYPGFSAYAAAKGGVNLLTLALDREGKEFGIRAYAVAPGPVETGMFRAIFSEEQLSKEKTLTPEDVAAVVVQCVRGALTHSGGETIFLTKA